MCKLHCIHQGVCTCNLHLLLLFLLRRWKRVQCLSGQIYVHLYMYIQRTFISYKNSIFISLVYQQFDRISLMLFLFISDCLASAWPKCSRPRHNNCQQIRKQNSYTLCVYLTRYVVYICIYLSVILCYLSYFFRLCKWIPEMFQFCFEEIIAGKVSDNCVIDNDKFCKNNRQQ